MLKVRVEWWLVQTVHLHPTPRINQCGLIWKRVFTDVITSRILRWDLPGSGWTLNITISLSEKRKGNTDTSGGGCVKTEAEVRVMRPQAKGRLQQSKAKKGMEDPLLEPLEGVQPYWHPDFRLTVSKAVRGKMSVDLGSLVFDNSLWQP